MSDPRISVLVPAYDEAENMPELFAELAATFAKHDLAAEVVLVDDGSADGTAEAAEEAAARAGLGGGAVVLRHRVNRGKTEAMLTAAEAARGEYLVLFDADLQHSTEEIPRFAAKLDEGYDLVAGRKVGRYEKRFTSSIYNRLARAIFKVPVRDLNSMKAFRADVLTGLRLRHDWHRYFVVLAHARGYRLGELDIDLLPRRHGEPKFSGRRRILIGMLDMVSVWFQLVFGRKPLLFFGTSGLALIAAGCVTGLTALVLRFGFGLGYRPLLTLVVLLVVGGLLLFILGFLAETMAQLRDEIEDLKRGGSP
ncbi:MULTISPECIES: glycosyltransferase [Candidatus Palauibacter]|uniref:glycosyltransferase n=1 Tax=Candidatus Palauibacter TaxID=3056650 RepID=UPI003B0212D7